MAVYKVYKVIFLGWGRAESAPPESAPGQVNNYDIKIESALKY